MSCNGCNRPSCLECVEKHLGAAAVLLEEVADGYSVHRLYAIGHLLEATVESREWPELSEAITAARREYQRNKTRPDFAALAELIERVRLSQPTSSGENAAADK